MKKEIKRIDPIRAGNITALVYGVLAFAFALLFTPFLLLVTLLAPGGDAVGAGIFGGIMIVFYLVVYPIAGLVCGWIAAALGAVVYNFVTRWTGGWLVEVHDAA